MSKRMLMVLSGACGLAALGMARAQAPAATETVLHNFNASAPKGQYPYAGLIRDSACNLYGTTWEGGTGGAGLVYKLDTAGHQRVLYSFTGGADGGYPFAGVVRDAPGNFYGTTEYGGSGRGKRQTRTAYQPASGARRRRSGGV
jgi:uncharacterized repeat protein (TIGR03803 family)